MFRGFFWASGFLMLSVCNASASGLPVSVLPEISSVVYVPTGELRYDSYRSEYSIEAGYPSVNVSRSGMYIKVLLPPGTVNAGAGGQFNLAGVSPLRSASFSEDVTAQACSDSSSCAGKVMSYDHNGVSHAFYSGDVLTQPRYATLALKSDGSTVTLSSLTFSITLDKEDGRRMYDEWRKNRPWAGGPYNNSIDGIGEQYHLKPTCRETGTELSPSMSIRIPMLSFPNGGEFENMEVALRFGVPAGYKLVPIDGAASSDTTSFLVWSLDETFNSGGKIPGVLPCKR